ncbi:MAG: glycosyltransferase family 9 protein [Aureispira sp.]
MPKFLILRFSSIGDLVATSPIPRWLKQQIPNAQVHYLVKRQFASLLTANPHVDKVFVFDKEKHPLEKVLVDLKTENYDWVLDLHKNWRTLQVRRVLQKTVLSFDKLSFKKWLFTQFHINKLPNIPIAERYRLGLAPLQLQNDGLGLDHFIPEGQTIHPAQLDPRLAQQAYIGLVIGAAHATKRLPTERLKQLCQALPQHLIVLLGGPDDQTAAHQIEQAGPQVINTCGQLSINQSASLVQQARVVVAHDTGLMHLAAAFKRPLVVLWGSTHPAFGLFPYLPDTAPPALHIAQNELTCRPCTKIGRASCPKGHFNCMQDLKIVDMVAAIETQWALNQ